MIRSNCPTARSSPRAAWLDSHSSATHGARAAAHGPAAPADPTRCSSRITFVVVIASPGKRDGATWHAKRPSASSRWLAAVLKSASATRARDDQNASSDAASNGALCARPRARSTHSPSASAKRELPTQSAMVSQNAISSI